MEPRSRRFDDEAEPINPGVKYAPKPQRPRPDELRDPIRKSEAAFTKDDEANTLIDLYLFGKGADINS